MKVDIMQLFEDFFDKKVDISRLSYGIITLLPKVKDAPSFNDASSIWAFNGIRL